jgi:hypothetical protein
MGHICSLLPSPSISSPSASYSFFRGGLLFWSSSILSSVVRSMWASDNICGEPNRWASPYEEKCLYLGCKDYAKRNQESMRYPILDPVIPVFYPVSRLLDFSPQSTTIDQTRARSGSEYSLSCSQLFHLIESKLTV